ncbi:hypothetical protein RJP21_28090 [Paenibacillus sp. VCA1]|uniref:hypothetical protein n=1 Tax=Paenibacillus sp. VCA1 TaxID=3039148 RepID=UPI002871200D|nr:hypothetical protein [Paenibacillus sp. VCA1]MDR9857459.1 hypothetical protein [Paenibacillus sp. VCA1]
MKTWKTDLHFPYIGSGPYCYTNSIAMMLGERSPRTAVIEFATSSPFGMQLIGGTLPFFDPYGWTPEATIDHALAVMGFTAEVVNGKDADDALSHLEAALENGPALVGPVEMGHLRYQPGKNGAIGADHYLVVLAVDGGRVLMHDPQGYPYASLPLDDFMDAWRAETIDYGSPFTMRTAFRQVRDVPEEEIIRASIPAAIRWLSMDGSHDLPAGSLGNGDAAERLAERIEAGCDSELRDDLIHFLIRVGTRRVADAATCLARVGHGQASQIAAEQAKLIGLLQYLLVVGEDATTASVLRELAPTYDRLREALINQL